MRSPTRPHACLQSVSSWLFSVVKDSRDKRINPAVLLILEGLSCYRKPSAKQALILSMFPESKT